MARNMRVALAVDRQEMALIRKAAKRTQMAVSEYIRETVLREAGQDILVTTVNAREAQA